MAMGELLATALGADLLERPGNRDRLGGCAPGAARRARPGATLKASLLSATCDFAPDAAIAGAVAVARSSGHHPGIHRRQRCRRHRAAGPRRLGYLRLVFRRQAERGAPGDLDRCARDVQRQSARRAHRAAAARPALRRGAGNRQQRREGPAPALRPAGAAVQDSACMCMPRRRPGSKAP